jgi:hypothetical protein
MENFQCISTAANVNVLGREENREKCIKNSYTEERLSSAISRKAKGGRESSKIVLEYYSDFGS